MVTGVSLPFFFSFCLFSDVSAVSLLEAPELKYGAQLSPSGGVPR